ncbi:hypothetical protein WA026_022649 [Henosepilachna vigintioctopunctata]|uniref:Integrase catalytic domain-containing protein n=1 Tax=Henosepilachna vigintioctopunctata TaxID=420089 RepID=A0AAW1UGW8_9CUCU
MAQDKFTKWIEFRPLRRETAPSVCKALYEEAFMKFGCPETVISDNGKQFVLAEAAKEVLAARKRRIDLIKSDTARLRR